MQHSTVEVAEAFSRKATLYDSFGLDHSHLEWMRAVVRSHVLAFLHPDARILEINAGTGADALFFARLGYTVHATDIAPGMLEQIRLKIERHQLAARLSCEPRSFTRLEGVQGKPYDYLFSNMGGVNCIEDLTLITASIPSILRTGGFVTWVVMPPICPWELAQALRGRFQLARRRLSPGGVLANVEGVHFMTYYYTPQQVLQAFGASFKLCRLHGLSVFTPTADVKGFPEKHPRLYRSLRWLDGRFASRPQFNGWGDFFILTLQYLPDEP